MIRFTLIVSLTALMMIQPSFGQDTYSNCLAAADYATQIREEIALGANESRMKAIYSAIQLRTRGCPLPASSDLWYLRSQIATKVIKDTAEATRALEKAVELNSPLLARKFDPFAANATVETPPPSKLGNKYALVVGLNEFKDKRIPRLNFAAKDASDLGAALVEFGSFKSGNVKVLTNGQATLNGVRTGIGWLRSAQPEDLVLIFLSSHGSPRNADPNGVSYIMMHDTDLEDGATRYATSLQMIALVEDLKRDVKAKRVVLIIDSCFSGDATGSKRVIPLGTATAGSGNGWGQAPVSGALGALASGSGRAVIAASRSSQESWESPALKNGYFTHFLLEGLKKDKGLTPLGQLYRFVRESTSAAVLKDRNAEQDPQWQGTATAESILLGAPEGSSL